MTADHLVYPGGPTCQPNCPGEHSMYHDGYADGYENAEAAAKRHAPWNETNPDWWREQLMHRFQLDSDGSIAYQWLVNEWSAIRQDPGKRPVLGFDGHRGETEGYDPGEKVGGFDR
jgi:hypothetical protein